MQIDEVVRAGGVGGEVIESKNDDYKVGDLVMGLVGWQQYCVSSCKPEERLKDSPKYCTDAHTVECPRNNRNCRTMVW